MNIKKPFFRFLGGVLSLLGFSSCFLVPAMYGSPYADFKASGKVTDTQGKAIEGIRVAVTQHRHYSNTEYVTYDQNDWYEYDTLFTDASGKYLLESSIFSAPNDVSIVFEDVDGPENGGEFETATATPAVEQTKKGGSGWYNGAYEVRADVSLQKK